MDFNPPFGAWVKARRKQLDLTQTELAERARYSVNAIRKVEEQSRSVSRALAEALRIPLEVPEADHDAFLAFARGVDVAAPPRLPAPPTPLIGRADDVAAIQALCAPDESDRLITLIGPPGVGKTRLALEVAHALQQGFADGAALVLLAPVSEAANIPAAIANALRLRVAGGTPDLDTVAEYLESRELLLVLDNVEHLLEGAGMVRHLLARCPGLHVLATSRAVLNLSGERVYEVKPLARPPAVALFTRQAIAVKPAFTRTPENEALIGEICRRLDDLPLAIELAAARSRMLTPKALLERLTRHQGAPFDLLTSGPRDADARQRTLRATIDWSFALLDETEQRFLRRMGVFAGGCTLDDAAAVCLDANIQEGGNLDAAEELVQSLLDKSLIFESEGLDGSTRYNLLEMIREYALLRLEASGETDFALGRLAAHLVSLGDAAQPYRPTPATARWTKRLVAERDNIFAALAWARSQTGDDALGLRLAGRIGWVAKTGYVWNAYIHPPDSQGWTSNVEERIESVPAEMQAMTLFGIADLIESAGDEDAARRVFSLARDVAQRNRDRWIEWLVSCNEGKTFELIDGNPSAAIARFEQSLSESAHEPFWHAQAQEWFGLALARNGQPKRAISMLEAAREVWRAHAVVCSTFGGMAHTEYFLGIAHAWNETFEDALAAALRSIDDFLSVDWPPLGATRLSVFSALAAGRADDFVRAARRFFDLPIALTSGAGPSNSEIRAFELEVNRCLLHCAKSALALPRAALPAEIWPTALTLIGRALDSRRDPAAAYRAFGAAWAHLDLVTDAGLRDGTRLRLEDHRAKALADQTRFEPWRAGERMSLDETLDFLGQRLTMAGPPTADR